MKKNLLLLPFLLLAFGAFAQPVLEAQGNQIYCGGSPIPVVTQMTITPDPNDTFLDAVYVQISSGYVSGSDQLALSGNHPEITATWSALAGKLSLTSASGSPIATSLFEAAVEDVLFSSSLPSPSGTRNFSITIGQANYLPSTQHYYRYIQNIGITWTAAKTAAENATYYGLQGYLATIGAADEAQLSGEQSNGAGWIGGSDAQQEGVWKWVTGPENGTIFWNNGVTVTYSNWNSGEPNNSGGSESYAHVTAPGVGLSGSWNDLSNTGATSGDYQPKGYIVEYGGMPGDPVLQIATSTTLTIPRLLNTIPASKCGDGSLTLSASAENGQPYWYDSASGGNLLFTGNTFNTPNLTQTTTYYVSAFPPGCTTATRTAVTATINPIPTLQVTPPAPGCEGVFTLSAQSSTGTVNWYDAPTDGNLLGTGDMFTTPFLTQSTVYYAEPSSASCTGPGRTAVNVTVYPVPVVQDEPEIGICEGGTATLDAGVPGMTYLWSPGGQTTQTRTVSAPGQYAVTVTSPEGCSATKHFTVLMQSPPDIASVIVIGNELTITTVDAGRFEYSIDGISWQTSPTFIVDGSPIDFVYAQQINGCGLDSVPFTAIVWIPTYFTPNGDGFHDIWTVSGLLFYPKAGLKIFDRYGKLIKFLNATNLVWDGTCRNELMPSDDYWFLLDLGNGEPEVRGHFTLKR